MILTSLATFAGVSLVSKAYWNTFRPELKNIHLKLDPNLTPLEDGLKILHLSDIHIENLSISADKVKRMIDHESFDLIALTGDYLDQVNSIAGFISFLEEIVEIPTRFGVYAVWGNHDWEIEEKQLHILKNKMEELGVFVLENEFITVDKDGTPIHLVGIDDHYSGHSDVDKAFQGLPHDGVKVVLTHDPLIVKSMPYNFDYLLSGHFHSGQIYYPIPLHSLKMGLRPFKKYLSGLQHHEKGRYYISGGLGQTGVNFRLGCRPEITIHTLQ